MVKFTVRQLRAGTSKEHRADGVSEARAAMCELCPGARLVEPKGTYRGHAVKPPYVLSKDGAVRIDALYIAAIWRGQPLPMPAPAPLPERTAKPGEKLPEVNNDTNPGTHPPDAAELPDTNDDEPRVFEMPSPRAKRDDLLGAIKLWNESASKDLQIAVDDSMKNAKLYEQLQAAVELSEE